MKILASCSVLTAALLLSSAALAGEGPSCSQSTTPSLDNTSFNVFYDAFFVNDAGSQTCNWTQPTALPSDVFGVYTAEYRGGVGPDAYASLTTDHNGTTTTTDLTANDEFYVKQYIGSNADGDLVDDLTLDIDSEDSTVYLDTADYALLGTTTLSAARGSLTDLATAETGIVTHLTATSGLLTGESDPFAEQNSVGIVGAVGSHIVGVDGHAVIGDGLTLDAGLAGFDQEANNLAMNGLLAAGKLRYITPDTGGARWFGAIGLAGSPNMALDLTRDYATDYVDPDHPDMTSATSRTHATLISLSGEAGVLVGLGNDSAMRLSGEVSQNWLSVDGFSETFSEDNLFPLSTDDHTSGFTIVKGKAAWQLALTDGVHLDLSAALGQTFANDDYDAEIAFIGPLNVSGVSETFAEAEARLGWAMTSNADLEVFGRGTFGTESGTHLQAGSELRLKF